MISFNTIPANVRVPLFYAEMDNSQASYFAQNQRALILGQKLAAGTAVANVPILVASTDQAKVLFGQGSMLARQHAAYRAQDLFGEVWCLPIAENAAGVAATGSIAITGPATAAGTLTFYIAGQKIQVGVAAADTATAVGAALAAAINANADLPVTGINTVGTVALTSRWKGLTSNDISVVENRGGQIAGEVTPAGLVCVVTALSGGTTAPVLTTAIANMGDEEYDFVITPFTDTTTLDALRTEMNDTTGRWSYLRQVYGHVYSAKPDTSGNLVTFGVARNDQHCTVYGYEVDVPNPAWEVGAAYAARNAAFLVVDPARPTQTGELTNISPPRAGKRFLITERQTLLNSGVATGYVGGGVLRIERAITTYQKNAFNVADPSYLDSETMHTSAYVIRRLRNAVTSKYGRHKLANDGTRFGAGQAIVTPKVIRSELTAEYAQMELLGIVEDAANFGSHLIVERNIANPNRVDVLFPPDYVNQLRIFALLNQFRLQYPVVKV